MHKLADDTCISTVLLIYPCFYSFLHFIQYLHQLRLLYNLLSMLSSLSHIGECSLKSTPYSQLNTSSFYDYQPKDDSFTQDSKVQRFSTYITTSEYKLLANLMHTIYICGFVSIIKIQLDFTRKPTSSLLALITNIYTQQIPTEQVS
ncbi:Hypothetical_protein [Hexamita inflata]|uniref:Hypothetical_protein n=1 Tax=Hexamita inflata TaxID=28002 RepID=A0AA86QKA4_9EUKA|nr:Hypothetical protein HINF_LOCUS42324 [Hexamita inflata]